MNSLQFDIIKKQQDQFLENIEKGLEEELADVAMVFPELKENILKGLRWGLFLKKGVESLPSSMATSLAWENPNNDDYYPILKINFNDIFNIEKEIKDYGLLEVPIFNSRVKSIVEGKELYISFNYETLNVITWMKDYPKKAVDSSDFLNFFSFYLTLPDAEEVFGYENFMSIPEWQLEYVDKYESWKNDYEQNLYRVRYVQIGGVGQWVQGCYNDCYVAQVNNEVGDGGSVYLTVTDGGELEGHVDMS